MKNYHLSIDECREIMIRLVDEAVSQLTKDDKSEHFIKVLIMQRDSLSESPPNLGLFASGGVGLLKTSTDESHTMSDVWRQDYTNVTGSISNVRHGVLPGSGRPSSS